MNPVRVVVYSFTALCLLALMMTCMIAFGGMIALHENYSADQVFMALFNSFTVGILAAAGIYYLSRAYEYFADE